MSRPIKYRAWVKDAAAMRDVRSIEWNYEGPKWLTLVGAVERPYEHAPRYGKNTTKIGAHRAILMQCTGLKDRNSVEIYEGDILDDGGVIEFRADLNWDSGGSIHSGFFSTAGYEYEQPGCLSYHYQIADRQVVGNIYEKPELLKGGDDA